MIPTCQLPIIHDSIDFLTTPTLKTCSHQANISDGNLNNCKCFENKNPTY